MKSNLTEYLDSGILAKENYSKPLNSSERWKRVPLDQCSVDHTTQEITLWLNGQETLRVEKITGYKEKDETEADRFRIRSIKIIGNKGELVLTGDQARTQFREGESGGREINYQ